MNNCKLCGSKPNVESHDEGEDTYLCKSITDEAYMMFGCAMEDTVLLESEWNQLMGEKKDESKD